MNTLTRSILAMIVATGLAAGCQQETTEQAATEEATAGDTENARTSLEAISGAWEQAVSAGNPAGLSDHYADDAVMLPEDMPRAEGRAAIEARLAEIFSGVSGASLTLTTDHIVVSESGDLAYAFGTADQSGTTTEGETYQSTGKWVVVMKNVGGEWKVVADIWNSDAASSGGSADISASGSEESGMEEAPTPADTP